MTSVGADKTFAHNGVKREFDAKLLPFGEGDLIAEKYEVIGLLGSGGMAFVVAARHVELDELVALKFLRPEFLTDTDLVDGFAREARASAKIENEHVVRILDVGKTPEGGPFIAMEYLDGKDLGALLREEGVAPVACASEYVLEGCEALAAAHALGIVHRDVKPDNLFLASSTQGLDVIKLLDFGISKLALTGSVVDGSGPRVKSMSLMGTPVYMSPEQIRASSDLDARTDIWSLGCVLYQLLTGHAPFEAPSITSLTASILERPAPLLREHLREAPAELEAVVARCLAKDRAERFQSVSQLAAALFPFAPRRARLSVERCSQILRHAGLAPAPLVILRSNPPPSSGRLPSQAPPKIPTTPPPKAVESTPPTSGEPTNVDVPLRPSEPARRRKAPLLAVVCVLVVAGALAALRSRLETMLSGPTSIATAVFRATPAPPVVATTPMPVDMTPPAPAIAEVDALDAKTPPTASAAPKPRTRKSRAQSKSNSPQEVDVGF
jgi:serine/threonine-protein kinase